MAIGDPEGIDTELLKTQMQTLMKTIGDDMRRFNDRVRDYASPSGGIGKLDAVFGSMRTSLLGTAGVAFGLYQAGRSLEEFAAQTVKMENFARNVGLTKSAVGELQQALRRTGLTGSEALSEISGVMGKINELRTFRYNSSAFQNLQKSEGGAALANQMMAAKDEREALQILLDRMVKLDEAGKRTLADAFNGNVASLERMNTELAKTIPIVQANEAAARQFNDTWINVGTAYGNTWTKMRNSAMEGANDIANWMSKMGLDAQRSADLTEKAGSMAARMLGLDRIKTGVEYAGKGALWLKENVNPSWDNFRDATGRGYPAAEDPMTADQPKSRFQIVPPRWKPSPATNPNGLTDFGGMRRSDSIELEQTSLLTEIRDTLQGRVPGVGTSSGGGAQYSTGGARANLARYLGMERDGSTPGTPGVGAERGKVKAGGDPRGMEGYIREAAKARGIDPDTAVAVAKSEGLASFQSTVPARGPNGREDSWGAFQLYKGGGLGNEFQKATGLDPADPANERATIDYALDHAKKNGWKAFHGAANTGISRWAGIGENGVTPQPGDGNPMRGAFGGDVREMQGRVAATRKGALSDKMRTALDYASAQTGLQVRVTSGGQRMHGAPGAVGSHRHDRGNAADFNLVDSEGRTLSPTDPRALEFYRYAGQAGVTGGGHSYMSDPRKIHLDTVGGVYHRSSGLRESIAAGMRQQDEFATRGRERMDAIARRQNESGPWGKLNGEIKFTNVPPGVQTNIGQEGNVFNELKVTKSRQSEVAGGSIGQPYSGVW